MNEILLTNNSEPTTVDSSAPEGGDFTASGSGTSLANYHEGNILSADYRRAAGELGDNAAGGDEPHGAPGADNAHGLPDVYELQAPEGMEFDTVMAAQFTPVAKELGLNNAQAQKLADLYCSRVQATCHEQLEQWSEMGKAAESRVREDVELGGGDEAFLRKRDIMKHGLANLPEGDELAEAISAGGAVHPNNLGLLRLLYREGLRISPDDFHGGGRTPRAPRDPAAILYPNDKTI